MTYVASDILVSMVVGGRNVSSAFAWGGPPSLPGPSSDQLSSHVNDINTPMIVGIAVAFFVVVVAVIVIAVYRARRSAKHTKNLQTALKVQAEDVQLVHVELKELLGKGAFGSVYKGLWQGVTVALKTVATTGDINALRAEAAILKALSHPNIVQFFGFYQDEAGTLYIVTEFMAGGALDIMLRQARTKMGMKQLLKMCRDVTAGMLQLEERGIVHCDLACRNLLLSRDKTVVKVSDFGLSRKPISMKDSSSSSSSSSSSNNSNNNNTNNQLPIKWCAPEVISSSGSVFTSRSDVWSLGVTMWEILSHGAPPFSGMTNRQAYTWLITSEANRLEPPEGTPQAICEMLIQCWRLDPSLRPTFADILFVLDNVLNEPSSSSEASQRSLLVPHPPSAPKVNKTIMSMKKDEGTNNNYNHVYEDGAISLEPLSHVYSTGSSI